MKGCRLSVGLEARTDDFGVNLSCETSCNNFTEDALKSACYVGCTHISPTKVESSTSRRQLFGILGAPFFSRFVLLILLLHSVRIFNFFKSLKNVGAVNPPDVGEAHVTIVIPGGMFILILAMTYT